MKDAVQAAQRHTTRTAFPVDVGVHRTAIEAMGDLRDAILAGDVEGATAALGCGAWTDVEFVSFSAEDEEPLAHLTLVSLATLVDSQTHAVQLLPLLAGHGANLHQVDSSGRTLLHFANDIHVARWLLEHGASPPDVGTDGSDDDAGFGLPAAAVEALAAWRLGEALPGVETPVRPPNRL
ncbi:hypothetical protein [Luteibacter sp. HA06]